jgi:hypothetical protein
MQNRVTMSAITALAKVYEVQSTQNSLTFEEACTVARASSTDSIAHDYEGANFLRQFDSGDLAEVWSQNWIRGIIKQLLMNNFLPWKKAILKGRSHVLRHLTDNERQVFQAAGLCDDYPDESVVFWWDELQKFQRKELESSDFREWELNSLNYENQRLEEMDCPNRAKWRSIDDNICGFDIESFDLFEGDWVSIAIEVKSRYEQEIVFEMTRNECDQMARMGERYRVHYWSKSERNLRVISSDTLIKNLPSDSENSTWVSCEFHLQSGMYVAVGLKNLN